MIKVIFPRYDHKLKVAVNIFLALLLVLPALISSYPVFAEPVLAPTVVSAATNVAGTIITITFNKNIANPGHEAGFRYKLNGGSGQSFSAAALNADNAKIDLTCAGTAIAFGDIVTLNYASIPSLAYVRSTDGGALAAFSDQAVTNNVLSPAKAITAFTFNGLTQAVVGVINEGAKTIALTVPSGTNVTTLVPTITITGASVNPASGATNNFTTPQTYTVTAADASNQAYVVTVTVSPAPPLTPSNPLIGTGIPTSRGGSGAGATSTTTMQMQTVSLPNIQIQSAFLSAKTVTPGTPITVTADIANKSAVNGNKKVTLYVNGQVETTQGVTVNSSGSTQLTFNVSRSEPGDYNVYVDGVPAGSFKVELLRESDDILIFSAILVALAFLIGIVMLWRRQRTGSR